MKQQTIALGKVCKVNNGKTPSRSEQRQSGFPILKIKDIKENGTFAGQYSSFVDEQFYNAFQDKKIVEGDILILNAAHNSAYVGSKKFIALKDVEGSIPTGEWLIIRSNKEILNPSYIYYWLTTEIGKQSIKNLVKGIHLYPKDVKEIQIPIIDIRLQERIVNTLKKVDTLLIKRQQSIQKIDELLQSVFYDMFGDPVANTKKWKTVKLSDVVSNNKHSLKRGPFGGSLKKEIFVNKGYKVYEQRSAIYNNFELGKYFITEHKYKEMEDFSISENDIIISCSGTIGKIAIVPKTAKKGIINQALLKITLDFNKVLPLYFKYLLESNPMQNKLYGFSRGSGISNFPPMETIRNLQIPLPSVIDQEKFALIFNEMNQQKLKCVVSKTKMDDLFQSVMHQAFNGANKQYAN